MALQGTLDTFALPDVLRLLAATKKTGRLRITGGRGTGSVWATSGEICGVEATHAPHATEPVDALFELLRFTDGAFTFDAEALHDDPMPPTEVEGLLSQAEAQLAEWREIEAVVPSMDAWVTLRKVLPAPELTLDQDRWQTLVAVGGGATVRRVADELCLAELPISRAIKDLLEIGVVDLAETAPAGVGIVTSGLVAPSAAPVDPAPRPLVATTPPDTIELAEPAPGPRARRARAVAPPPAEPEVFVPLDLPGQGSPASYDEPAAGNDDDDVDQSAADLAAAFPGLAAQAKAESPDTAEAEISAPEDEEIARQLSTLSPRAAQAIRAAAAAGTEEERDAALDEADSEDQPLNRGLLLKFLSSVKS